MFAAAAFPSWVLLEHFVFRRDGDESFPDEAKAPVRASGTTSWGAPFTIAFSLAEPPLVSRLYAQLPGFPDPREQTPLHILGTHRRLSPLDLDSSIPRDLVPDEEKRTATTSSAPDPVDADSDSSTSPGDQLGLGGAWNSMRVEILCSDDDDGWQPCGGWQTNAVIPFRRQWLCWVDYYQGILLCDVFRDPSPSVSFLRLPLDSACTANIRAERFTCLYYRAVSVVDDGRVLKFVNVTRHDGVPFGTLKPGTGFTITCHTLLMSDGGGMAWEEDYKVTSDQLWDANLPEHLPRDILMYPQVDIERPHVVHFLFISQWKYAKKKMSVVSIDMSTMAVESLSPYINGHEGLQTDDADLIRDKSMSPMAFLPCEFPKYLSR
ncbi:unnamed protein product [Urochloa decumbens]|uniref:DUF1618 domain-containing protein n=1 Tax=Urochloa decumbens TaxID=240449 RepID=A0ABC9F9N5_9POAL